MDKGGAVWGGCGVLRSRVGSHGGGGGGGAGQGGWVLVHCHRLLEPQGPCVVACVVLMVHPGVSCGTGGRDRIITSLWDHWKAFAR